MAVLKRIALECYDRIIGLGLSEVAVDCCITKAPRGDRKACRSPVDRGKKGIKRSVAVYAEGVPLGVITAPANRHDLLLLSGTLEAAGSWQSRRTSTSTAPTTPNSPERSWPTVP